MYAIVRSGGKQYRVEVGRTVTVERLQAEEGATVELGDVLLIADDGDVMVGAPRIEGARVLTTVEQQGRHKKITVFKYKAKVRTRKKTGHRQRFTRLAVEEILRPGQEPKAKPKRRARRKKAEEETPAEEPVAEAAAVEGPAAEAPPPKPKPRTRRKKAEEPAAEAPPAPEAETAPKRRTARKKAEEPIAEAPAEAEAEATPKTTRRRTVRRKKEETE